MAAGGVRSGSLSLFDEPEATGAHELEPGAHELEGLVCDVAVPVPLGHALTYALPAELSVEAGSRVLVELGRKRTLGVVLSVRARRAGDRRELKRVLARVEAEPVLPPELLRFLLELSRYYLAPVGEVLRLALPAVLRSELGGLGDESVRGAKAVGRLVLVARATEAREEPGTLRGNAHKLLALLRASGELPVARLADAFANARDLVGKLEQRGLVSVHKRERELDPFFREPVARDEPPTLNAEQSAAAAAIEEALSRAPDDEGPRAFLLFGVTGSGKTEVYLRAIAACLARGKGALVLVPEIALTPQLVSRFRARFGDALAVLHSGLGEADRHAMWARLRRGEVTVAIGARSALFAPVPELGLVLVDEEHDGSFKQEEGVRYHARDMALLRAHRAGAVCVLGSATPSLESVDLVRRRKLGELRLPRRASPDAVLPDVTVVDLRRMGAGPTGHRLLSLPLHRAIEETLARGEQVILFLNRRGFAPSIVCERCGELVTCLACSVALTFHKAKHGRGEVRCHYCDYRDAMPELCPGCRAPSLVLEGLGTERLEDAVAEGFPRARVVRLDRDVASGAAAEGVLEKMRAREADVLVGTQMVTKGHDLPGVTLVGVINADAALGMPDFRAGERGFSLLVQVAGRAGRADRPGRVLVQTRNPAQPAIAFAKAHDVDGFLAHELRDRAEVGYPPATRLVLVRLDALDEDAVGEAARAVGALARATSPVQKGKVEVLGPAPAPLARLRGRYRYRVVLRSRDRAALREVAVVVARELPRLDHRVRATLDVDPVSML
jgi:primosomal protein N' (replication factor Y)